MGGEAAKRTAGLSSRRVMAEMYGIAPLFDEIFRREGGSGAGVASIGDVYIVHASQE